MPDSIYKKEYQTVIKRLKDARVESGLKQEEVANKLGKPQSYVSKIERGERRVDIAEIKLFAKVYQKSIDYFI
ncbi:MAG: helix-turn-helix transcriptional regulator [Candidatus Pacebacteria bacterium]|jgi:transcriptional regulator with XRE-family HTH domain|nr:helix-turn-helix transcriptional regulator [Candidatus Paceibacterota bacterium]